MFVRSTALFATCLALVFSACGPRELETPNNLASDPNPTSEPATTSEPDNPAQPHATLSAPSEAQTFAFARSTQEFGVDLYRRLATRDAASGNLLISPASLATALAMTYGGARGQTATQMAQVLHFGDDAEALHRAAHAQIARWNDERRSSYTLRVVNRIFVHNRTPVNESFGALTRDFYAAPAEEVDFGADPEAARSHINGWIEEQTNDRIQNLLPPNSIDDLTRMVLTNAIYFLGNWQTQFDPQQTRPGPFHLRAGGNVQAQMMHLSANFQYTADGDVQVLQLPYAGGELAMTIVLPVPGRDVSALERALSASQLVGWFDALAPSRVDVELPRFTIEPERSLTLKPHLEAMGMPLPFSTAADFSAMSDPANPEEDLHIDNAYHRAFVQVNEEGTEAAAASAVVMAPRGGPAAGPLQFTADRPFLFFIRDVRSGSILFMGRLENPV